MPPWPPDAATRLRLAQLGCVLLGVVLIVHATFRGRYADLDAFAYIEWYDAVRRLDWSGFVAAVGDGIYFASDQPYRFEIGFGALAYVCATAGLGTTGFFFVCALLSLAPKVHAFIRYSHAPLASFAWYGSWYYLLLEMNAIRAGIAAGILLMGLRHLLVPNLARFLPYVIVASTFHVSAVVGLALFAARLAPARGALMLAIVGAGLVGSVSPVVELVAPLARFSGKLDEYLTLLTEGQAHTTINPFNVITLSRLAMLAALAYALSRTRWRPVELIGLWAMTLSLALYFAFASFPIVAGRLSELVAVFQVFAAGALLRLFTPAIVPRLFFAALLLAQFWAVTFRSRLVDVFYFTQIEWLRIPLVQVP